MDRMYMGYPNDGDVDALLSQLTDENLMKLKINSHSSTKDIKCPTFSGLWSQGEGRGGEDADGGLDEQLSSRLANLKAHRPSSKSKGKDSEVQKESSGLRRSSSKREDGMDKKGLSRSQSHNTQFHSLSGDEDLSEELDNIDANLVARFNALKGSSSPKACDSSRVEFSGAIVSPQSASHDEFYSGSTSPSAMLLLGHSSSRSSPSPRIMTTSVATSCHCSTPSPLKLLKQLSSKKIPSKPASLPLPPSATAAHKKSASTAAVSVGAGDSKPVGKESSKKNKTKTKDKSGGEAVENLTMVKDVRRLLSSVADRVGLERSRVSSAEEEDDCLGGDPRVFSLLDREQEFAKASSEEEKLNHEAERVVEWAKDAARLGLELSESEEELELGDDSDLESVDSTDDPISSAKSKKIASSSNKPKKRWGWF